MKPNILVASIFHSGTFFIHDSLLSSIKRRCIFDEPVDNEQCKYQFHLFEPNQELLKKRMLQCLTIVPTRKYKDIENTWKRNNLNIDILKTQYEEMLELKNVFLFDIEADNREDRLRELSDLVGANLSTDWSLVNSTNFAQG